jgi:hypothetical protein
MVESLLRAKNKLTLHAFGIPTVKEVVTRMELCNCQLSELLRSDDADVRDLCFLQGACKMKGMRPTSMLAADGRRVDTDALFPRCSASAHTLVTFKAGAWKSKAWGFLQGDEVTFVVGAPIPMTAGAQVLQVTLGEIGGPVVASVQLSLSMFVLYSGGMGEYGQLVSIAQKRGGVAQLAVVSDGFYGLWAEDWPSHNARIVATVRTVPGPPSCMAPRGIVQPGIDTYYITAMTLPVGALAAFGW